MGGEELLEHAERTLGVGAGGTTSDGLFTLEDVECIAACTEAPACQVNYRYANQLTPDDFDQLIADLRSGARDDIPAHGTLAKVRQDLAGDRIANITPPEQQGQPVWIARHEQEAATS
jgi:NADH-quinone oxidoreductase subunit E